MPSAGSRETPPERRRGREHDPERAAAILGLLLRARIDLAQGDVSTAALVRSGVPLRDLVAEAKLGLDFLLDACRPPGKTEGSTNTLALWLALSARTHGESIRQHLNDHANWGPALLRDAVRAQVGWKLETPGETTEQRSARLALEKRADRGIRKIEADRELARKLIAEFCTAPERLVWLVLIWAVGTAQAAPCAQCGAPDADIPMISLAARVPDSANEKWEGALHLDGVLCPSCWERAPRVRLIREPLLEPAADL